MKQNLLPSLKVVGLLLTFAGSQLQAVAKEPTVDDRFRNTGRVASEDELPLLTPPQSKLVHENPSADVISGPAYLGVTFGDDERSAVVRSVAAGSPAEQAGLKPGDVVETLQGIAIDSPQDVLDLIKKMRPGTMLDIGVSRRVNLHAQAPLAILPGATLRSARYPPESSTRELLPVPRSVQTNTPKAKPQPYRNTAAPRQTAPSSGQRRSNNQTNNRSDNRGVLNRGRGR